jgi:endonuclease G
MGRRRISRDQWIYILLLWVAVAGFWWIEKHGTGVRAPTDAGAVASPAYPDAFLPEFGQGERIDHDFYSLSYVERYEQAAWVAYTLDSSHLTGDDRKRPYYIQDPSVPTGSADWRNFRGSGYDRGHLCPAGDRRFSETAYNQTFYTSNISPQDREFNAGIWNELEQQVRRWARRYGRVYVITGGVLSEGLRTIGSEGVAVPGAFYKVVIRQDGEEIRVLGFLMSNHPSDQDPRDFMVSLDELESATGIDFFPGYPAPVQESLEQEVRAGYWEF